MRGLIGFVLVAAVAALALAYPGPAHSMSLAEYMRYRLELFRPKPPAISCPKGFIVRDGQCWRRIS